MVFHSDRIDATAFAYPGEPYAYNFNSSMPDGIVPDTGTAYALVPIEAIKDLGDTHPYAGLYLSVDQALGEFYFASGHGWKATNVNCELKPFETMGLLLLS